MTRCVYCRRWIWPWSRIGFLTMADGKGKFWHPKCRAGWLVLWESDAWEALSRSPERDAEVIEQLDDLGIGFGRKEEP
ncbi:MAG: hypothetical protein ACOYB2_10785 [Limnohabitans sp.]